MKTFSPSIVRLEKSLEVCAQIMNSLGCQSVHIDVSWDLDFSGFYGKEILVGDGLQLFDCPATIHIFSNKPLEKSDLTGVRQVDAVMLHVTPETSQNDIISLLESSLSRGYGLALALDIRSDISLVLPFLGSLKAVYVMGIPVATHSRPPQSDTLSRLKTLQAAIKASGSGCRLGIDGGINYETLSSLAAVADEIVIGGLLFNSPNIYSQWQALNAWLKASKGA